jgi:predicted Zn-dependent protease
MNRRIRLLPIVLAIGAIAWFYFSSPTFINPETGRKSKVGLSEAEEQTLGLQSFQQVLTQSQTIQTGSDYNLVVKVARRLITVVDDSARSFQWRVALVQNDQQNAFCLPGGEIVVYTGILLLTQSEAGLATVLGHEIAHATSRHGAQRIFQQNALQIALMGVQGSISDLDDGTRRQLLGLLGAGAQYGVLLPFSRQHELEADQIGLKYMAKAGYNPQEALAFWKRMMESKNGQQPPELMSTHPADSTRISQLETLMPSALEEYQKVLAASKSGS